MIYYSEIIPTPSPVHNASNMCGMETEKTCIGCDSYEKSNQNYSSNIFCFPYTSFCQSEST